MWQNEGIKLTLLRGETKTANEKQLIILFKQLIQQIRQLIPLNPFHIISVCNVVPENFNT